MKKAVENYVLIGYYTVERGFIMSYNVKRKSALDVIIRILLIALVAVAVIFAVKVVFSAAKTAPVAADAATIVFCQLNFFCIMRRIFFCK